MEVQSCLTLVAINKIANYSINSSASAIFSAF
jgi:hypothetical protein